MRKTLKRTAGIALALCMGTSMVACGGGGNNEGVCEIKAVVAGHGVDWLHEAAKVFNASFKDQGYEVKVTLTDISTGMADEMITPKRNTTDLYFDYTATIKTLLEQSRSILGSGGGLLLEDVSDVLASKAIGKDGKEQGGAISERIEEFDIQLNRYNGNQTGFDGVYGIPWYGGGAGVYVNKKVLAQKGYTLDSFLTSDSIIEISEALAPPVDKRLDRNQFFPVAWTGQSAGYWQYWTQTMLAQYMGEEAYYDFADFIPEGGEDAMLESGWTVYENRGIYETLKVAETLMNRDWAVPGTVINDQIMAQAKLMEGDALFMVSGDWLYKEMQRDYEEYLNDIIAVKTPVLSALGVKLGLCGTTHPEPSSKEDSFVEDYSCDACEAKLRAVIKAVDTKDKSKNSEIASELGVTEEQVATVRERRGYYENTGGFSAIIPSYSAEKETAKMFLRFMCSDDGINIYREYGLGNFKARYINEPDMSDWSESQVAMYEKMYNEDAKAVYSKTDSLLRVVNGIDWNPAGQTKSLYLNTLSYSHATTTNSKLGAKYVYLQNITIAKGNWGDWIKNAGLSD